MNTTSETPPVAEMIDTVLELFSGLAIGVLIFPGFLLCVPGLVLAVGLAAVPLLAVGALCLVGAVAAAVVALPFLAGRWLVRRVATAHAEVEAAERLSTDLVPLGSATLTDALR